MSDDQAQTPKINPKTRFQKWLQLLEAHAMRQAVDQAPHPRCLHGRPWDDCQDCGTQPEHGGEA